MHPSDYLLSENSLMYHSYPKRCNASLAQFPSLLTLSILWLHHERCCCGCSLGKSSTYPEYEVEKNQDGFGRRDSALAHVHPAATATALINENAPAALDVMIIKWLRWSCPHCADASSLDQSDCGPQVTWSDKLGGSKQTG